MNCAPSQFLAVTFFIAFSVGACGGNKNLPAQEPQKLVEPKEGIGDPFAHALYDRLGGKEGIDSIADTFLAKLIADARVSDFFKNNKTRLGQFRQQICQLSGGPCQYRGKDMKTAHVGMRITDVQFDAFIEDLMLTLDEKGASAETKKEILSALAPMRASIVETKRKN